MTATLTTDMASLGWLSGPPSRPRHDARGGRASLREDERGAVMITGLFMACFLIGALWFVMGVGDTVVFRNRMQEAADSGAFSSAALHAKGMNFISLCNLVMVVGTVIHIILGIISDVTFAIMVVACLKVIPCPPAYRAHRAAYKAWDSYFKVMSKAFKAIHVGQKVASYAYPAFGVIEAYQNGSKYGDDRRTSKVHVVAVSSSLIPGGGLRAAGASAVKKEGLPVSAKPFGELCKKVVSVATNAGVNLLSSGKGLSGKSLGGKALGIFNSLVGSALEFRYCNKTDMHFDPLGPGFDSFWGEDGPYVVYAPAKNGNDWMQTWAINIGPSLADTSESHVGLAARRDSKYTKQAKATGYFAQSEFYFDCSDDWGSTLCNKADNATFAIKWRARMRRVELPAISSLAVGAGLDAITNLPSYVSGKGAAGAGVSDALGKALGAKGLTKKGLDLIVGKSMDALEDQVKDALGAAAGKLDPKLADYNVTSYH